MTGKLLLSYCVYRRFACNSGPQSTIPMILSFYITLGPLLYSVRWTVDPVSASFDVTLMISRLSAFDRYCSVNSLIISRSMKCSLPGFNALILILPSKNLRSCLNLYFAHG